MQKSRSLLQGQIRLSAKNDITNDEKGNIKKTENPKINQISIVKDKMVSKAN